MNAPAGVGLSIKRLSEAIACRANRDLQSLNLTFSQSRLLLFLRGIPDHTASLKELENRFHAAQSTICGLVDRMEQKQLITCVSDPQDKRVKQVCLTEKGLALSIECHEDILATEAQLTSPLNEEEIQQLLDMLNRMFNAVK